MICSHCNSTNIQSHITKRDKKPLVVKSFLITYFVVLFLSIIIFAIIDEALTGLIAGFFVLSPNCGVLAIIICLLIPNKDEVVFICDDCGKITKP